MAESNATQSGKSGSTATRSSNAKSESELGDDFETLKSDFASLRDDLKHMLESALGEGKSSAKAAKHRVEEKIEKTSDSLEESITQNPFASVAIAAAVGVILGFFFRRG